MESSWEQPCVTTNKGEEVIATLSAGLLVIKVNATNVSFNIVLI